MFKHKFANLLPFSYLTDSELKELVQYAQLVQCEKGDVIFVEGDQHNLDKLFLLYSGSVSVITNGKFIGTITAPSYFGERAAFFHKSRSASVLADGKVEYYTLERNFIFKLFKENPGFCYAYAALLRHKHGIFEQFDNFISLIVKKRTDGNFLFNELLDSYRKLSPSLHRYCNAPKIDFDALSYAISRLPENITLLHQIVLSEDLPEQYKLVQNIIKVGSTKGKKKYFYEIMPGKVLVILRDDTSDYIDFLTKFCIFQVEIQKIID